MASEENNPFLPNDIIINILKRLHVKSLIHFQSVCKDWKILLKTSSFITDHLHHSHHRNPFPILRRSRGIFSSSNLYFLNHEMEIREVPKTPFIKSSHLRIVGSSNGLLCVLLYGDASGSHQRVLSLLNPATREVRYAPESIKSFSGDQIFGFGFSPIVNDYKIVRLYCTMYNWILNRSSICVNHVEVYSLSTRSWKEVEFGIIKRVKPKYECAVTANGSMFWLAEEYDRVLVVSFDIATEVFKLIPIPTLTCQPQSNVLTVYENKLAVFHFSFVLEHMKLKSSFVDLLVMEEGTSASGKSCSWSKIYEIGPVSAMLFPMTIWKNEIICRGRERLRLVGESESEWKEDCFLSQY